MKTFGVLATLLLFLSPPDEKLSLKNYDRYRAAVNVKPSELTWQQVEWRTGFWNGLIEAQAKDKPIFYWIYEGEPRGGC